MFPQFASRLIRNGATLGGNLGTASPIGDAPPVLLALDASLVLASSQGEREVRLDGYFTGYRQSVKRPDELIKTIRIPRPVAPVTAFHKIAKRRFDDISSVAVAYALRLEEGEADGPGSPRSGSGWAAWRPRRCARVAAEDALTGRPWTREVVEAAAEELARAGTPMSDHRASEAYRIAMLRNSLLKFFAEHQLQSTSVHEHRGRHESRWPIARTGPWWAWRSRTRARTLHVTGAALYTQDLVGRTLGTLHAWPVQAPHAHARVTGLRTEAAYQVPGVVRVLTADDVPGLNDAGEKHDEPLFPGEVMYYGHAVCWVLGETLEAARQGADSGRGQLRAAARADHRARRDPGRQLSGPPADGQPRRRGRRAGTGRVPVQRRARDRRPGALLPGDAGRAGAGRRERPDLRPVEHAAPVARRRTSWRTCSACPPTRSPCSACGWAAASAARSSSRTAWPPSPRSAPR